MEPARDLNPYLLLRLGTTASKQEVIRRSRELSRETLDRGDQAKYRRAVEEICQHPVRRARSQFWEPPATCYEDEAVERFCETYRAARDVRDAGRAAAPVHRGDCSVKHLAVLAVPPVSFPSSSGDFSLAGMPQAKRSMPLEPWELFT